jgi:hypothetical protein
LKESGEEGEQGALVVHEKDALRHEI